MTNNKINIKMKKRNNHKAIGIKIGTPILALFMAITLLAGCGSSKETAKKESEGQKKGDAISVVTTIYPIYDWTREVTDKVQGVDLSMLINNGVDVHSYQPSVEDIVTIATCDVFIYVGGESDKWVSDALAEAVNENMVVVNLMECLGNDVKEEDSVEGMETDEHIWLSLKNAKNLSDHIASALSKADPQNADRYKSNADSYKKELSNIDASYKTAMSKAVVKTVVFGDRFPFRYLFDDYGLNYYAAFNGCSAETEASFETITFLSGKVDELGLNFICTTEGSDGKIAETIKNNTVKKNQEIAVLDSMQSVTAADIEAGTTYAAIMKENLEVLRKVLQN